jgi:hypothetical protein
MVSKAVSADPDGTRGWRSAPDEEMLTDLFNNDYA